MEDERRRRYIAVNRYRDDHTKGRPIEELIKTNETLSGIESLRLRTHCTSICMEPSRDLDDFGEVLFHGDVFMIQMNSLIRVDDHAKKLGPVVNAEEHGKLAGASAAKELYDMRWGPTKTPIFNLLGLFSLIRPSERSKYLDIARHFIDGMNVPVDGVDLSGTTALSHCFSTKPGFDLEYAQMLYDAGGDVNHRNRYGCTVAQEICQVYDRTNKEFVRKATASFKWFLSHGGNVDIEDTDGWTVRKIVGVSGNAKELQEALAQEDKRRTARGDACCKFCGREDIQLLRCGRCKAVVYCAPPRRKCQRGDWPRHKKECKA